MIRNELCCMIESVCNASIFIWEYLFNVFKESTCFYHIFFPFLLTKQPFSLHLRMNLYLIYNTMDQQQKSFKFEKLERKFNLVALVSVQLIWLLISIFLIQLLFLLPHHICIVYSMCECVYVCEYVICVCMPTISIISKTKYVFLLSIYYALNKVR